MNAGQKSMRRAGPGSALFPRDRVCTSCRQRLFHQSFRHAANAAVAAQAAPDEYASEQKPPVSSISSQKAYRLLASTVVSRPPLLTRELSSFEKAFYLYQKRLNERLALPFTRYFYFKKGTPADIEWKRKAKPRKTAARDIGVYSGYGEEAWNDEVLVGDTTAESSNLIEALIRDAEGKEIPAARLVGGSETSSQENEGLKKPVGQEVEVEEPVPRTTDADKSNDLKSLNRKLHRSLYLLVKTKEGRWRFPEDRLYGRENLHQAAERIIIQSVGINMNTWIVGNHPVGHYTYQFPLPKNGGGFVTKISPNPLVPSSNGETQQEEFGEKVFFMKGRIMAGQADISKSELRDQDFQWLTKEEIETHVTAKYWSSIKNMLSER